MGLVDYGEAAHGEQEAAAEEEDVCFGALKVFCWNECSEVYLLAALRGEAPPDC